MHERKSLHKKVWNDRRIYPTYEPYPVSWDTEQQLYSTEGGSEEVQGINHQVRDNNEFNHALDTMSSGGFFSSSPDFPDERAFRPLKILNSLFSDRLDFLNRALEELENARNEREKLTHNGLGELDSQIKDCEHYLSITLINYPEQKRHLERKLMELKHERRREKLLNWRDLVWLRGEIRKLQRQIETLGRTAKSTEKQEVPK